jgi:hypothetical protein
MSASAPYSFTLPFFPSGIFIKRQLDISTDIYLHGIVFDAKHEVKKFGFTTKQIRIWSKKWISKS